MHSRRHVAERRNLADLVKILERRGGRLLLRNGHGGASGCTGIWMVVKMQSAAANVAAQ